MKHKLKLDELELLLDEEGSDEVDPVKIIKQTLREERSLKKKLAKVAKLKDEGKPKVQFKP